jgi:hypothetical protein
MAIDFMGFINAEVPEGWDAAKKQRLRDSFVYQNGYTDTVENPEGGDPIPNPVSKNDFGNQVLWILRLPGLLLLPMLRQSSEGIGTHDGQRNAALD